MITPAPCSSIVGKSARSNRTADNKLRSSARYHSLSSSTAKPPAGADDPPTTWTRMSRPPRRSRTASATTAQPSAVARSAATNKLALASSAGVFRAVVRTFDTSFRKPRDYCFPDPLSAARDQCPAAIQFEIVAHERISSAAILSRSSVKTNSSSIGLPGKLPVSRLVTMVLPSF